MLFGHTTIAGDQPNVFNNMKVRVFPFEVNMVKCRLDGEIEHIPCWITVLDGHDRFVKIIVRQIPKEADTPAQIMSFKYDEFNNYPDFADYFKKHFNSDTTLGRYVKNWVASIHTELVENRERIKIITEMKAPNIVTKELG